jgi:predicted small metal-binding protein
LFTLACADVMPGCRVRFAGPDSDAMLAEVVDHAVTAHGLTEVTPDVVAAVDRFIVFIG